MKMTLKMTMAMMMMMMVMICGDDDGDDDEKKKKKKEEEEEEEEERAFHIMSPVVICTAVGVHGASSCWRGHPQLSCVAIRRRFYTQIR